MIKAVLLDLDDTLLWLDTRAFLGGFSEGIAAEIVRRYGAQVGTDAQAIREQIRLVARDLPFRHDGIRTNRDIFEQNVGEAIGLEFAPVRSATDYFYANGYYTLHHTARPKPGAAALLNLLAAQGYTLVIATNPFFPLAAVQARMGWGGLPLDLSYALITNADEMHYVKPNREYYREILEKIGVQPAEAIMIGDNAVWDIDPAVEVGMYGFWIDDGPEPPPDPDQVTCHGRGSLSLFADHVQAGWLATLTDPALPHR